MSALVLASLWLGPLFEYHEVVVRGPPPPPPPPALPLGFAAHVLLLGVLAMLWWIARRRVVVGTRRAARIAAFGLAIGNALVDLSAVLQPDRPTSAQIERVREQRPVSAVGDRRDTGQAPIS